MMTEIDVAKTKETGRAVEIYSNWLTDHAILVPLVGMTIVFGFTVSTQAVDPLAITTKETVFLALLLISMALSAYTLFKIQQLGLYPLKRICQNPSYDACWMILRGKKGGFSSGVILTLSRQRRLLDGWRAW
jgi:hypothetical protein